MTPDSPGTAADAGNWSFATTRWSVVLRAGGREQAPARRALAELCERYWLPLYAFARRKCGSVHEAQDLTQGFFVDLLESDLLHRADPNRGRFRSYLLAAFQHFLSHQWERQRAQKRGGARPTLSLDFAWAESRFIGQPAVCDCAEQEFERLWAMQLLDAALEAVRRQYAARGQEPMFAALKPFVLGDQGQARLAQAAEELGIREGAAKVGLHRLRTRFRAALRAEISATVTQADEVDDEIRRLFAAFN